MLSYLKVNERHRHELFINNNSGFPNPFSAAPCNFRVSIETEIDGALSFNRNICNVISINKRIDNNNNNNALNVLSVSKNTNINNEQNNNSLNIISVTKTTFIT
jgi:hypothetical protein